MPLTISKLFNVRTINLGYNPTLESVLMVENTIEKTSGEFTAYQIWKKLPRKISYQSFKIILSYLIGSNKITVSRDRKLVWIWNPELIEKLEKKGLIRYV